MGGANPGRGLRGTDPREGGAWAGRAPGAGLRGADPVGAGPGRRDLGEPGPQAGLVSQCGRGVVSAGRGGPERTCKDDSDCTRQRRGGE